MIVGQTTTLEGRRTAVLVGVLALLATLLASPPAAGAGETETFSFQPSPLVVAGSARRTFSYGLEPGGTLTDAVRLSNKTTEPRRFRVYAADATEDPETGKVSVAPFHATPRGVGSWIDVERDELELPARSNAVIDFTLERPEDVETAGIGALVAEELAEDPAGDGIEIVFRIAIVVRLDGETTGLSVGEPRLDLPLRLVPSAGEVSVDVTNETLQPATATVALSVNGLTGRTWKLPETEVRLEAGQTTTATLPWDTVPRWGGLLRPRVEVSWAAGTVSRSGDRTLHPPLWLVALLVLAAVVRITRRWWAARSTGTVPAPDTADLDALEQRLRQAALRLYTAGSAPDPAIRHEVDAEARAVADAALARGAPADLVEAAQALAEFAACLGRDAGRAREAADRFDRWYSRASEPQTEVAMTGAR